MSGFSNVNFCKKLSLTILACVLSATEKGAPKNE